MESEIGVSGNVCGIFSFRCFGRVRDVHSVG